MDYSKELGIPKDLKEFFMLDETDSVQSTKAKLIDNICNCANDKWGYVNSYLDGDTEFALNFFMDVEGVYNTIYDETNTDVFKPGSHRFNEQAAKEVKNHRFLGTDFKRKIVLCSLANLYTEAVDELELTDEQKKNILEQMQAIKSVAFTIRPIN